MESGAAGRVELLQGRACLEQQPHAARVALGRGPVQRGVANPSGRLVQQRPPDNDNTTSARPTTNTDRWLRCSREEESACCAPSLDHGLERDGLAAFGRCEPSLYQRAVHRRPRHRDQHGRLRQNDIILRLPDLHGRQKAGRWLGAAAYRPAAHGAFLLGELLLLVLPSLRRDLPRDNPSPATTNHHRSDNTTQRQMSSARGREVIGLKTQPSARSVARKRWCRSLTGGVR